MKKVLMIERIAIFCLLPFLLLAWILYYLVTFLGILLFSPKDMKSFLGYCKCGRKMWTWEFGKYKCDCGRSA
jgi:hypothetical protein